MKMATSFRKKKKSSTRDNTAKKHVLPKQLEATKWKPGVSPNPAGRPKGSRNKLGEAFLKDFLDEWEQNGKAALKACRIVDPARFCSIAASLLPKELSITDGDSSLDRLLEQFTDEQLEQFINGIMAFGAQQIEGRAVEEIIDAQSNSVQQVLLPSERGKVHSRRSPRAD